MENNISKSKIVHSLAWKFLERLCSQGINLAVQIILARLLLPEAFGSLAIIAAITNYASIFVQSGLATTIVQRKDLHPKDVSTLLTASVVVAAIFVIALFFLSPWIASEYGLPDLVWPLRVLSLILLLNAFNSVQTALLSRDMDFRVIFWRSILAVPISGGIGIAMAYCGFDLWSLVALNLTNVLVTVIVMRIGSNYDLKFGFSWTRAKSLYSFGGKILLTGMVSGFGDTFRTMLIGKKYNADQLAYYDKGYIYSLYITQIVNATLQSVMLPAFSKQQDNPVQLQMYVRKSIGMTAFIMSPILFGVMACAKPLVILLLSDKWAPAIPFLMIFCLLRLPACLAVLDKQVFYALGKSQIGLFYEIGLLILNIIVLLITAQISIFAIAIGATVVEYLGCISIFIIADKIYGYNLISRIKDIYKSLMNSIIMSVLMLYVSKFELTETTILMIQVSAGFCSYILLSAITKDTNIKDLKSILAHKRKSYD